MKYFYDTEFIEDGKTIDLVSIGIISEDGRELYMESADCDFTKANQWVMENVLVHLVGPAYENKTIAEAVYRFCDPKIYGKPELWGYYSAYDHVLFCQLFGTMMDLPKGFPMHTNDLKQWCDQLGNPPLPEQGKGEHHALADAKWNRLVWNFLREIEHRSFE
jgi:hypothetical protein